LFLLIYRFRILGGLSGDSLISSRCVTRDAFRRGAVVTLLSAMQRRVAGTVAAQLAFVLTLRYEPEMRHLRILGDSLPNAPLQGDQIGRIYAYWAIVYFGQFLFENRRSPKFCSIVMIKK
jgi:hypothetical protein